MAVTDPSDAPQLAFASADEFATWLSDHHGDQAGIWLKLARKGSGIESVTYDEALEEALTWGWIDGQRRSLDAEYHLVRFTPRRARSAWSRRNVRKAEALIAGGRMRPPGQREVDAAKADGRWDSAYEGRSGMQIPAELATALAQSPRAAEAFAAQSSQNRYAMCYRISTAKRSDTRGRKAAEYVAMLERGETIH
jgi:uncharacterized protein YdeI (YjbR/CyaY-like superfamily)